MLLHGPNSLPEPATPEPRLPNQIPIRLPPFVCQNPANPRASRASRFGDNVFPKPVLRPSATRPAAASARVVINNAMSAIFRNNDAIYDSNVKPEICSLIVVGLPQFILA